MSASSNVYVATSRDGLAWTAPLRLSPDTGREKFDVWPTLLLGPGDQYYAAWLSWRLASASPPAGTVMVPVYTPDYSYRFVCDFGFPPVRP